MDATVSAILVRMIQRLNGNHHDINHFMKVYTFARTIAEQENLPAREQEIIQITAIVHDIACPLCREKYGSTDGKLQEAESEPLVREFLGGAGLPDELLDRIVWIVCHHHTLTNVQEIDHKIILEADYLVNADEHGDSETAIRGMLEHVFRTRTGSQLLRSVYSLA